MLSRHSRPRPSGIFAVTSRFDTSFLLETSPDLPSISRGYKTSTERTRSYQKSTVDFLKQLHDNQISRKTACVKVEEMLLKFLALPDNVPMDGPLALDLLNAALRNASLPNERLIPRLFSLACQVMIRSGHPLAAKEVHRQLWNLLECHKNYLTNDLPYNTHHVNDACKQWIEHIVLHSNQTRKKIDYETAQKINRLKKRMQQLYEDRSVPLVINAHSCNTFIMYFCNQQKPQEAYRLLKWMIKECQKEHSVERSPRVSSFTATISAFSKSGAPEMALEIVQQMLASYKTKEGAIPPPNTSCFNALIDAWAISGRNDAGEKAEQTIEWMQQLHETENLDTAPNSVSYSSCINAWSRSPIRDAPVRAEATLQRMVELYKSGSDVAPTESAFTSVMNAWANSGRDVAPTKVVSILGLMKEMSTQNKKLQISDIPYAVLIKSWEQVARQSTGPKKKECADKGLQVLELMETDGIGVTPGVYNALIMALLSSSATDAVFYFLELEEGFRNGSETAKMNTRTFNSGLNAIAALNKPNAADKAMEILQRMFEYSLKDQSVRPDETTFNVILKVLSRCHSDDAASKANALLDEMNSMPSIKPSSISYLTCIIAWGRSNQTDKFHRVTDLLSSYKEAHSKGELSDRMTVTVFNAALSVCYHNESVDLGNDAWRTALTTMGEWRKMKRIRPDHTTYLSFFRVMSMLSSLGHDVDDRDKMLQEEFAQCTKDGLVSREIVELIHQISPEIFNNIFGDNQDPKSVTIPEKWSKQRSRNNMKHNRPHAGNKK